MPPLGEPPVPPVEPFEVGGAGVNGFIWRIPWYPSATKKVPLESAAMDTAFPKSALVPMPSFVPEALDPAIVFTVPSDCEKTLIRFESTMRRLPVIGSIATLFGCPRRAFVPCPLPLLALPRTVVTMPFEIARIRVFDESAT